MTKMMIASHYTSNAGARLHFVDSGAHDQRAPIVFVPGMTCVAEDYPQVLSMFGRRIIVVEIRGHGRSSAPATGYDFATLCDDVGAVIDAVTDGPVHLVTFSRGTSYALGWALAHPDRVRSVAIGDYVPEERVLTSEQARQLLDGRWRGSPVRERLDERAALQTFAAAQHRSLWEPLARLQVPMLVVRSGNPILINDTEWDRYRQLFAGAQLIEFEDSPHDIFRPERDRYPQLVREHVDRADGITH